ncbi:MAG: phosphoribosylanthranilate isomerase [Vulcanimicrobiaceae bacterium]
MQTRIKFCGMTGREDIALAREYGATHIGMIFAPSPRRIPWEAASGVTAWLNGALVPVAVFVDPAPNEIERVLGLFPQAQLQFAGNEMPASIVRYADRAIKVIHVGVEDDTRSLRERCNRYGDATVMFDTGTTGVAGGSGTAFAWELVEPIARERRVWIAGGLRAENVAGCIATVRPFGVDVRSGIETGGRKDVTKMRAFVTAVRDSDAT